MNESHAWLIFMDDYQTLIIAIVTLIMGVFTGVVGAVYSFWKVRELRLRKVEQVIGHKVLSGEDEIAFISAIKACRAGIETKFDAHILAENKELSEIKSNIKYIRSVIDGFIAEMAKQAMANR